MSMKLHDITGKNRYCGPAVIAALTGITTDEAADAIRHHSGQRSVRGAFTIYVLRALRDFGIESSKIDGARGLTLAKWSEVARGRRCTFLVVAGNHFQIVKGDTYTCGRIRARVSLNDKLVSRRARVEEIYELSGAPRRPTSLAHPCSIEAQRRKAAQRSASNQARRQAVSLAEQHGCRIEVERVGGLCNYWVSAPDELESHQDYPWYCDHVVYTWGEVSDRIRAIVEFRESLDETDPLGVL